MNIEAVTNMLANYSGYGYAMWGSYTLQPGGDINPIAENIITLSDNVTNMHADAKGDSLSCGQCGVWMLHDRLNFGRTSHGAHHARELGQNTVAGRFEDTPTVLGDFGVDDLGSDSLENLQCASLILAHEPAIADYIGCKDGS
jgi:hypothetical protein